MRLKVASRPYLGRQPWNGLDNGITINCVAPGLINAGLALTTFERSRKAVIAKTPMKRAGEPEEVAACVRFLASEEASFITGQTIFVCGGLDCPLGIEI